jgi:hypothetical protein
LIDVLSTMGDDSEQIRCPVTFVVGTGKGDGRTWRGDAEDASRHRSDRRDDAECDHIATVPVSYTQILPTHRDTVAAAIDAVVARTSERDEPSTGGEPRLPVPEALDLVS